MSTEKRFPPEWIEQSAVLLAWPYADGDFSPWLAETESTYCAIAKAIAARQSLIVVCQDDHHAEHITRCLSIADVDMNRIRLTIAAYNDIWVRDTAPLFIETPQGPKLLDFRFNGWGNKYEHDNDAKLASAIHGQGLFPGTPLDAIDFVLEGGSLETDGEGTLLTSSRCLLNPNRNPNFNRIQIEALLKDRLGLKRILWLHNGHAEGDDTDAHIDTLARFCDVDTIAYTACDRQDDPLFQDLAAMAKELSALTTPSGLPYHLVPLPIPKPIYEDGQRLPATYANFLIINGAVLLPTYRDPADQTAIQRLRECFPTREIIPIYSTPLIRQYGSIHCMTMQFPKATSVRIPA